MKKKLLTTLFFSLFIVGFSKAGTEEVDLNKDDGYKRIEIVNPIKIEYSNESIQFCIDTEYGYFICSTTYSNNGLNWNDIINYYIEIGHIFIIVHNENDCYLTIMNENSSEIYSFSCSYNQTFNN